MGDIWKNQELVIASSPRFCSVTQSGMGSHLCFSRVTEGYSKVSQLS